MHIYNKKRRIAKDRPHGVNIPGSSYRRIKCVSGDTLMFTTNVVCPSTREPVKREDLDTTHIYIALAENKFSPVLWSGSALDGWVQLDEYRNGLIHVSVPRTVMNVLRRGSYLFSIVVDDGIVRETQLTGTVQIDYEPTGSINDIPYRHDQKKGNPISLTPEVDLAAQEHNRLTYDQLVKAVDTISRTMLGVDRLARIVFGRCDYDPTEEELAYAVHKLAQLIIWDSDLRKRIPTITCETYDPTYDEVIDRVCFLLTEGGINWAPVPCRPKVV